MKVEMLADGLGWPEGPAPLPDGRILFVETYRSQVSVWRPGHAVEQFAYVGGGPNAVLAAADGYSYVTQNGGVIGPWRATDKRPPSIQRITPAGKVEVLVTEVAGHRLRAPNDLAFGPDGRLYFTDPGGAFDPVDRPDPSRIFALNPDGTGELILELEPVYSNGIVIEANGDIVWVESYTNAVKRRTREGRIVELCVLPDKGKPDGFENRKERRSLYLGLACKRPRRREARRNLCRFRPGRTCADQLRFRRRRALCHRRRPPWTVGDARNGRRAMANLA